MIKDRYNICLLAAKMTDAFSRDFVKGAVSAAKKFDTNLTIFPGCYLGTQELNERLDMYYEYQDNVLFDYAAKAHFDYVIAAVGTIAYSFGSDRRREFLQNFKGVPVMSAASKIEGYDYLEFDNGEGIAAAVNYLARQGRKHICIMAGERDNYDCNERYSAYRRSLAENGLDFKERYLNYCDISYECREDAEKMLDNNPDVDAVICVNDIIASVLYDVLTLRGIEIGKDVAVVGFDNQPFAVKLDPPLASVKADARRMGYVAVEKAVNYLRKIPDNRHVIETEFIPRRSCYDSPVHSGSSDKIFAGNTEEIKKNLRAYLRAAACVNDYSDEMLDNLSAFIDLFDREYIQNIADETTEERVYKEIWKIFTPGSGFPGGYTMLNSLHKMALAWLIRNCRIENVSCVMKMHDRFSLAMRSKYIPSDSMYAERANLEKGFIRDSLMFGVNLKDSYADILRRLCNIGSLTSYLYVFDKPIIHNYGFDFPDDLRWHFKSYSYGANTFSIPEAEQAMDTREVFRNHALVRDRPRVLVAAPLYTAETQYGLVLLEPESDFLYEELDLIKFQLSSAVRTLDILKNLNNLLNDVTDKNSELESETRIDELSRVYNRRGFYAASEELIEKYKGDSFVICYTDTDELRSINESYGHIEGDFVIKLSSDCLRHAFGKSAVIGRLGGGEFAVIISKSQIFSIRDIDSRKERFVSDFNASGIKPYDFDISTGIVETEISDKSSFESALEKACVLLLAEKQRKRKNNNGE